jgi:hypothetical protein
MSQARRCREESPVHGRMVMVTNERRRSSAGWDGSCDRATPTAPAKISRWKLFSGAAKLLFFAFRLASQSVRIAAMKKSKITGKAADFEFSNVLLTLWYRFRP